MNQLLLVKLLPDIRGVKCAKTTNDQCKGNAIASLVQRTPWSACALMYECLAGKYLSRAQIRNKLRALPRPLEKIASNLSQRCAPMGLVCGCCAMSRYMTPGIRLLMPGVRTRSTYYPIHT